MEHLDSSAIKESRFSFNRLLWINGWTANRRITFVRWNIYFLISLLITLTMKITIQELQRCLSKENERSLQLSKLKTAVLDEPIFPCRYIDTWNVLIVWVTNWTDWQKKEESCSRRYVCCCYVIYLRFGDKCEKVNRKVFDRKLLVLALAGTE